MGQVENKRRRDRPKKLSVAVSESHQNKPGKDLRNASDSLIH